MPLMTSASNAFPSSSNSSTLSESAPWRSDKPCRSPDCPPEREPKPAGSNTTLSVRSLLPGFGFVQCFLFLWRDFLRGSLHSGRGFFRSALLRRGLSAWGFLRSAFLFLFGCLGSHGRSLPLTRRIAHSLPCSHPGLRLANPGDNL